MNEITTTVEQIEFAIYLSMDLIVISSNEQLYRDIVRTLKK